ncbi:Hemopexin [Cooperia oncophora]
MTGDCCRISPVPNALANQPATFSLGLFFLHCFNNRSFAGPPARRETSQGGHGRSRAADDTRSGESKEKEQEHEQDEETEPHPCTSGADAVTTFRGEFIVFKGKWLWRVVNDGQQIYGPIPISDLFPGLPEKVDAAVEINGQIWIFSGNRFWIFLERRILDGPRPLSHLGSPRKSCNPPATYLWAERDYWKLDVKARRVEQSYARLISLNWKHVPHGATAAFTRDKELHFMASDLVYRMNTSDYRLPVADGYPVLISKYWSYCTKQNESMRLAAAQTNSAISIIFSSFLTFVIFLHFPS